MTACAMTVGMVPMALALERSSQMQAPLGLAVIGGLVMSTFATLLVVPSIFAVVIGNRVARSPSIYPDDRNSKYYDPRVFAHVDEFTTQVEPSEDYAVWEKEGGRSGDQLVRQVVPPGLIPTTADPQGGASGAPADPPAPSNG